MGALARYYQLLTNAYPPASPLQYFAMGGRVPHPTTDKTVTIGIRGLHQDGPPNTMTVDELAAILAQLQGINTNERF